MIPQFISITLTIFFIINTTSFGLSYLTTKNKFLKNKKIHNVNNFSNFVSRSKRAILNAYIIEPILIGSGLLLLSNNFVPGINILLIIKQLLILFIFDDTWFYWAHRMMHSSAYLYKKIHSVHHIATVPMSIDMHFTHPLEIITSTFGFFIGVIYLKKVYYITLWSYTTIKLLHELNIHSGIKSIIADKIPLIKHIISGTEEHDLHHSKLKGNYGSTFKFWDWLCGTCN